MNVTKAGQVLTATVRAMITDTRFDPYCSTVCETDDACANFPLDSLGTHALDENVPRNMTCFKGGQTVLRPQQMCDVTSELAKELHACPDHILDQKILDMLPGRPPQVTFGCNADNKTCQFEFWIGKVESFYCALDHCTPSFEPDTSRNKVDCENIKCSCVTGRMLCGEAGSVGERDSELFVDTISRAFRYQRVPRRRDKGPSQLRMQDWIRLHVQGTGNEQFDS